MHERCQKLVEIVKKKMFRTNEHSDSCIAEISAVVRIFIISDGVSAIIEISAACTIAPLAQLDRASGYEPEGREFESLRAHHLSITYGPAGVDSIGLSPPLSP